MIFEKEAGASFSFCPKVFTFVPLDELQVISYNKQSYRKGLKLMFLNAAISVMNANVSGLSCLSGGESGLGSWTTLLLPLLLVVVMIVVMIIPQRRREKKVKDMLGSLKQGDRVRTIGGIYGTISSIKDDVIILSVGPDKVKLVFARGAISQVEDTGVENTMDEEVHD